MAFDDCDDFDDDDGDDDDAAVIKETREDRLALLNLILLAYALCSCLF